jgi:RNA recognition motif-containing protein
LRRLFEKYGVVTECDIMNRCGFVHMQTQEMAEAAIKALNNSLFNGANIVVEKGRMKERKQQGGTGMNMNNMNNMGGPRKQMGGGIPMRNQQGGGGGGGGNRQGGMGMQRNNGPRNAGPQMGGFRGKFLFVLR